MDSSFHGKTKAVVPNHPSKSSTYWVAVLKTDKRPEGEKVEDDYLWVKCHAVSSHYILLLLHINDLLN